MTYYTRDEKAGMWVAKIGIIGLAIVLCGLVTLLPLGCQGCTSGTGYRDGVVQKISHKGIVWKTNEAEMRLGGIRKTGEDLAANLWQFSIWSPRLMTQLKALPSGQYVRLYYRQHRWVWRWKAGTGYEAYRLERLDSEDKPKG